jgi:hypothetical protein
MVLATGVVCVLPALAGRSLAAEKTGTLPVFQDDFGGVGLLQTPTARMAPTGEFSFHFAHIHPYTNYAFSFQPLSWLQAGFRYTSVSGRAYNSFTRNKNYLDKGVSVKFRLSKEGRFMPRIAAGFRDLGGTGLFSSEYFVANKRWYDLDFSFGVGWGYLGSRGDINNPLAVFSDRFKTRQGVNGNGKFNFKSLYTGKPSFFGGIQYQTPFKPLTLQLEYEGNNYQHEPLGLYVKQDWPVNVGAQLRVSDNLTLSAAWERGNTAMFGGTLQVNFDTLFQPKSDPPPVPPKPSWHNRTGDWHGVATKLAQNAGIHVDRISKIGHNLVVTGVPTRYRSMPEAELRGNRILHNAAGADITQFDYRWKSAGFYLREDQLPRKPLPATPLIVPPISAFSDDDYRLGVVSRTDGPGHASKAQTLYKAPLSRFSWGISPGLNQNFGGPDGYLYQLVLRAGASFQTDTHGWFSGTLAYTLVDNLDKFHYIAPSQLPRVRSYIGEYLKHTTLGIYNLQYTRTARLSKNLFGMGYAGLLEEMYAGAGGEILYRPFNSHFAFGIDGAWVKQRGFDTQFDLRDYHTVVGNATAYIDTGYKGILAQLSVGRYLAKDYGGTINLSREFKSGVIIGAYATFTTADNQYGEGSFNKGIYLSMPLDLFFTNSTRGYTTLNWSPLTRDGGAQLARRYTLYGLTGNRALGKYWDDFSPHRP